VAQSTKTSRIVIIRFFIHPIQYQFPTDGCLRLLLCFFNFRMLFPAIRPLSFASTNTDRVHFQFLPHSCCPINCLPLYTTHCFSSPVDLLFILACRRMDDFFLSRRINEYLTFPVHIDEAKSLSLRTENNIVVLSTGDFFFGLPKCFESFVENFVTHVHFSMPPDKQKKRSNLLTSVYLKFTFHLVFGHQTTKNIHVYILICPGPVRCCCCPSRIFDLTESGSRVLEDNA
jgi:hypothetical protein